MMRKMKYTSLLLFLTFCLSIVSTPMETVFADSEPVTVILSSPDDAYYALAEEIAGTEGLNLYATFEEAAAVKPTFLLWVIAPENVSDRVLLEFSSKMKAHSGSISVGIISGQTMDDARGLWERGRQHLIPANDYAIINGNGATQKIEPEIIYGGDTGEKNIAELSQANVLDVLASQSNVQISVEGTATSWFDQHADITIHGEDIPQLNDTLILHYGCSTFRIWEENSIANACVHQGALAYIGFIYPSIVGSRFGDYDQNGLLYTWEKFPLGHLVQIQNLATMQSYADIGHFFMLGDPRIYRQSKTPYTVVRDEVVGNKRFLEISNMPVGVIPIYVPDGAEYDFVSISGLTSSSMNEAFFNRHVQMMNVNNDKFVVVENQQENIRIELTKETPALWEISSTGIKFMDLVIVDGHNASLYVLIIALISVLMIIRAIRKRMHKRHLLIGAGFGLVMSLIVGLFTVLRMNHIEGYNAPLPFNFLYIAGIFISTMVGLMLFLDAKGMKGKLLAILVTNLNSLITVLIFMVALIAELIMFGNAIAMEKATYPWLFPLQKLLLGIVCYGILYTVIRNKVEIKDFK